jgi:hypothetical protein
LSYLRGRYYDSSTRRFTTSDPAEDGLNWFSYCGNNPLEYVDPSGYARAILNPELNVPMGEEYGIRVVCYFSEMNLFDAMQAHKMANPQQSKFGEFVQLLFETLGGYIKKVGKLVDSVTFSAALADVFDNAGIPDLILEAGQNDQAGKYNLAGLKVTTMFSTIGQFVYTNGELVSKAEVDKAVRATEAIFV